MKLTTRIFTLVLTCMMLLTSCATETNKAENEATATIGATDVATSTATTAPTESSSMTGITTETTKPTSTTKPTGNPTKNPTETAKPTTDSSKKPTKEPSEEPIETSKPDTSWGKNDLEKLLPVPLPFTDITVWVAKQTEDAYYLVTDKHLSSTIEECKARLKTIEEYAESFKSYGFTIISDIKEGSVTFVAINETKNQFIEIRCNGDIASIKVDLVY